MHIIADSSSTRTEWALVDGSDVVERGTTAGLNPYFHTRRELSHIIRLGLPESFFRHRWDHVYFYGAGCGSLEKIRMVESSLVAQFKTPATVMSDLQGAAHGMLIDKPGLVAILSTGANSCFYDGKKIIHNVRPGGYILGDEGSNAYLGKLLLSDILKGIAPPSISEEFYRHFETDADSIMDNVYLNHQPNTILADYSFFLANHLDVPYCSDMVYNAFMTFFRRNIGQYDYTRYPLSIVGTTGNTYRSLLEKAASDFGITINKIEKSSLPGLIIYHNRY